MDIFKDALLFEHKSLGEKADGDDCINYWREHCNLTEKQVEELREYNREITHN